MIYLIPDVGYNYFNNFYNNANTVFCYSGKKKIGNYLFKKSKTKTWKIWKVISLIFYATDGEKRYDFLCAKSNEKTGFYEINEKHGRFSKQDLDNESIHRKQMSFVLNRIHEFFDSKR